jgi:hypothetical protein
MLAPASAKSTTTARFKRAISLIVKSRVFVPNLAIEKVVILSTIRLLCSTSLLRSLGFTTSRKTGAGVDFVLKGQK